MIANDYLLIKDNYKYLIEKLFLEESRNSRRYTKRAK